MEKTYRGLIEVRVTQLKLTEKLMDPLWCSTLKSMEEHDQRNEIKFGVDYFTQKVRSQSKGYILTEEESHKLLERSILAGGDENIQFMKDPNWVGDNPSDSPLSDIENNQDLMGLPKQVPPIDLN